MSSNSNKSDYKQWQQEFEASKKRDTLFTTVSGSEVPAMVTQHDMKDWKAEEQLAYPGQYPYTRGVHPSMYRGRLWTMRMFSGFATPEDTNARYKYLAEKGQTGFSVAFDLPTLMGRDSDDPWAEGEVGKCGVAVCSLRDMEVLFDGLEMEKISTSMTINSPAAIIWAFYIAAAEKQGADRRKLRGTCQNDILKEYIAQKEYIFPPTPSMRLQVDTIEFGTNELPEWNTISISGYHIREAGSTAVQELAFTLSDGFAYVEAAIERGLDVDAFAPRLSHFFNAHLDFFEEIAKYRAARRIWAKRMRYKYGAKNPRSWLMRFHTQTAGCSLTAQQPENNIVRTAIQALLKRQLR
jgi:methylmalonyl-CoA mutase N-terminal domain/subunit